MTQEDILRMARECFADPDGSLELLTPELTEFAALVAAAERERAIGIAKGMQEELQAKFEQPYMEGVIAGAAAEREACADICDQHASIEGIAQRCADAIRARSRT